LFAVEKRPIPTFATAWIPPSLAAEREESAKARSPESEIPPKIGVVQQSNPNVSHIPLFKLVANADLHSWFPSKVSQIRSVKSK
jgi:hypothetical protein